MPVALYRPRRPRASPLWQCLSEHRQAFEEQYPLRFQKQDGPLRAVVAQTLDAFTACGDLTHGFARLHCDHCGHDYLIAFSCKQQYFCPCCHQKKVQQFGEFVRHEVVRKVPHRQIVITLPKRLRKAFQRDRQLLSDFCHAAWLSLRDVIRTRLGDPATGDNRECPPQWDEHERTWDPCAQQWQDTPLAKWARSAGQVRCAALATVWDNIDSIPPEDEPVFPPEDEPVFFTD
jgi:hypothetical protein